MIWLFALVAAYPYIPGSDSEAFKGVGVFVGLMLSIGSSGIVNQAVSGMMLMYTRSLRPGEFVQIGETEGTVTSIGFMTTRLETVRRGDQHSERGDRRPMSCATTRVSRPWVGCVSRHKVNIGYDIPWRQVHAMLLLAAGRTSGLVLDSEPRVLQTALLDFYVEYTLLVAVADPSRRAPVLSELNANIQDVFNENGVQIMTPNYEADPAAPKVVASADWFRTPRGARARHGARTRRWRYSGMSHSLRCWKCGASLAELSLPLRRTDECRACRAELHVCLMCEFYDTSVAKSCRETIAEEVKDKQRANFCDYFRPSDRAFRPRRPVRGGQGEGRARGAVRTEVNDTDPGKMHGECDRSSATDGQLWRCCGCQFCSCRRRSGPAPRRLKPPRRRRRRRRAARCRSDARGEPRGGTRAGSTADLRAVPADGGPVFPVAGRAADARALHRRCADHG